MAFPFVLALLLAGPSEPASPVPPPGDAATLRGENLYRMTLLRAAPGRLLDLIAEIKGRAGLMLRHSQGDQWDVMTLAPASYAGLAAPVAAAPLAAPALIAWQEDEFVRGPDLAALPAFGDAGLYHVEMFHALAGRRQELVRQREMENAFLKAVGRPQNAIFVREFGAAWDVFTVGAYRDWKHYAERDPGTPEQTLAAARAAGFESDATIGAYLRALIQDHHDTLATPLR